jgi:putative two-component system response regulator
MDRRQTTITEFSNWSDSLRAAKLMIADDEPINVTIAQKYLNLAGYEDFVTTSDSRQIMALLDAEQPDALLLDIMMPHVSGLDILAAMRADIQWKHLPVIVLTASMDQDTRRRALELGASDFLAKPVDPSELIPRVHNVLTVKRHHDHMQRYAAELEAEVLRRTAELARSRQEVIHCLARAAEFRDNETGRHVLRVGRYARLIAFELGWQGEALETLEQAAQLHDIGKIGIPDAILLKPGKLLPDEFTIMQQHAGFGSQIIGSLPDHESNMLKEHSELGSRLLKSTESPILNLAGVISLSHHEKWDGSGYPLGLAGKDIPIEGRITAVADVFDALSSKRPYKPAFPLDKCLEILEEGRGRHFDPRVLDAFLACLPDVVRTQLEYADD